ncbi:hypothetical protein SAMN05444008_12635 [Cnuella takakiae]|uniref:Uncharacterized protein n=1 Tax=Cnuella takakiae TaxID=1302690 RepID=A0A1M5IY34_9BACT|nr:hypothetical protein SAMN05444008_12635 [Cnuella takakiae]
MDHITNKVVFVHGQKATKCDSGNNYNCSIAGSGMAVQVQQLQEDRGFLQQVQANWEMAHSAIIITN